VVLSILIIDLCLCALALWIDRADPRLWLHAPAQRLGLPTFLFGTFCTVVASVLAKRPILWRAIRRPKFHPIEPPSNARLRP
jgi:hypothetical protein